MQPDTTLTLGEFQFSGAEIPAEITFGGAQALAVHTLIGGRRIVDALGEEPLPLSWSGIMRGGAAHLRARYLDTQRVKGGALKLTWGEFTYTVVIKEFHARYQRSYQIPYSIKCEVVGDETKEMNWVFDAPPDQALGDDMNTAGGLGAGLGDGPLSTALGALEAAIKGVSSFAKASSGAIQSVLQPLAASKARVGLLIASCSNALGNVTTFGGVLPGNKVSASAAKLAGAAVALSSLGTLYQLSSVLGRMGGNLEALQSSGETRTVAGGNLFDVANQQYGAPSAWTGIAAANGTVDPFVSGTKTLVIPPAAADSGGVPQA